MVAARARGPWPRLTAVALLALMASVLVATITRKSLTTDEITHIPAGYSHLVAGDFRVNNEHPPLAKLWAALPLLVIRPQAPPLDAAMVTSAAHTLRAVYGFWPANAARFESIVFWTRAAMILSTLALGWLLFETARRFFGERAALFALALFVTEPTILAHGRIVHTDVPATLAYLALSVGIAVYAERPALRAALWVGLAGGAAMVTKFSLAVLVPPVLLVAGAAQWWRASPGGGRRRTLAHALVVAGLMLLVINLAYRFQRPGLIPADVRWLAAEAPALAPAIKGAVAWLSAVLPTYFLFGLGHVATFDARGHDAFLLGRHGNTGWWWYFPAAFALKTSLPFLLVAVAGLVWGAWAAVRQRRRAAWLLLAPCLLYVALVMRGRINIGVRYLLPAYPFLFILGGALLDTLWRAPRAAWLARLAVVALLSWAGVEAARAWPDYMTYMNPLAWREPRYQYLSDSNTEWGDEVGELARYLKDRGETHVRAVLLGSWPTLPMHGITIIDLFGRTGGQDLPTRYVAIGASLLNGSTVPSGPPGSGRDTIEGRLAYFAGYRARTPERVFAHSIYLYRLDMP